ncbi:FadR/GntR family transcriptional regulator [Gordonia sp. (in: high G+C Gram-positive bacteria)]|uniref:FadR/GntR family transcriptional regulator n=2 Tax=Gordonia sp. (in: high G+C Gram-positive bacteria) TaxID=84139 RepID=UPI003C7844F9
MLNTEPSRSTSAVFTPLRSGSLVDQISDRIAESAESGVLRPGQRLPNEVEFAAALGVSPLTVREALARLRDAEIVVTTRGRTGGSFISAGLAPSTERAEARLRETSRTDIFEMGAHYEALAVGCARAAARRASPSDLKLLGDLIGDPDSPDVEQDPTTWRQLETEFLVEVAAAARIARLARALIQAQSELGCLTYLPNTDPDYRRESCAHRSAVLAAIAEGSEANAESAIRALITHTVNWLLIRRSQTG